jgi:hypothetical protein
LDLSSLSNEKLRIFLNQRLNNVTCLRFLHSDNLIADLRWNWKHLTRITLYENNYESTFNLNSILDELPNLEYLSCSKKSEFATTDRVYPKIREIHVFHLTTCEVALLNALPNLQILNFGTDQSNFEYLRKIASMNLKDLKIVFKFDEITLETNKDELLKLLDQIFRQTPNINIEFFVSVANSIQKMIADRIRDADYFYGKILLLLYGRILVLARNYRLIDHEFPFNWN